MVFLLTVPLRSSYNPALDLVPWSRVTEHVSGAAGWLLGRALGPTKADLLGKALGWPSWILDSGETHPGVSPAPQPPSPLRPVEDYRFQFPPAVFKHSNSQIELGSLAIKALFGKHFTEQPL